MRALAAAAGVVIAVVGVLGALSWWAHTAMPRDPTAPLNSEASGVPITTAAVVHADIDAADVREPGNAALVFTGGPTAGWTPRILDVLAESGASGSFFFEATAVSQHPDLVQRAVADGHTVGLTGLQGEDLVRGDSAAIGQRVDRANTLLAGVTGFRTRLVRPLGLLTTDVADEEEQAVAEAIGDSMVVVSADRSSRAPSFASRTADLILDAQPPGGPGAVIEFSAPADSRAESVEQSVGALRIFLPWLAQHEWTVVPLADFIDDEVVPAVTVPAPGATVRAGQVLGTLASAGSHTEWLVSNMSVILGVTTLALTAVALFGVWHFIRRRNPTQWAHEPDAVSVVIPCRNEEATIASTLAAVAAAARTKPQVIVVDDGSTDATAEVARQAGGPGVEVISTLPAGKAAALNTGVRQARHGLIVTIDADTLPQPAAIDMITEAMQDPTVGAVSGAIQMVRPRGLIGRFQAMEFAVANGVFRRSLSSVGAQVCVPGAFGVFRRTALSDIGGFSDRTVAEDTDATVAIQRAGWKVGFEPGARALTVGPANLRQFWHQRIRWSGGVLQVANGLALRTEATPRPRASLATALMAHFAMVAAFSMPADIMLLAGIVFGFSNLAHPLVLVAVACQLVLLAVAMSADDLHRRHLLLAPLYWLLYRPLLYLVVVRSLMMLAVRDRFRWSPQSRARPPSVGLAGAAKAAR